MERREKWARRKEGCSHDIRQGRGGTDDMDGGSATPRGWEIQKQGGGGIMIPAKLGVGEMGEYEGEARENTNRCSTR